MSKVTLEFDTDKKTAVCMIDNVVVENLSEINVNKDYLGEYHLSIRKVFSDKENGMEKYESIYASKVNNSEESEKYPGLFSCSSETLEGSLIKEVQDYFNVK